MVDVYTLAPINKTASTVVSQAGCTTEMNTKQKLDVLAARWRYLSKYVTTLPKNSGQRKSIGLELKQIQDRITKLKPKKVRDLEPYIIDILKARMTTHQWAQVVNEAKELKAKTGVTA